MGRVSRTIRKRHDDSKTSSHSENAVTLRELTSSRYKSAVIDFPYIQMTCQCVANFSLVNTNDVVWCGRTSSSQKLRHERQACTTFNNTLKTHDDKTAVKLIQVYTRRFVHVNGNNRCSHEGRQASQSCFDLWAGPRPSGRDSGKQKRPA